MSEPLTIIARVRAKPGQEVRLLQELKGLPASSREEAGCLSYDLHHSQSHPAFFLIL